MAPVTIARFVQELEKLKQVSDAEKLKPQEYDSRLARIIQELREKGIDADRAATTAALADAVKRGIITPPVQAHLQRRLGVALPAAHRGQSFGERHALPAVGADRVLGDAGKPGRVLRTGDDGPTGRRPADDIEQRPRDVHGLAADVEPGLALPQFFHVVPRATAERAVDVRSQSSPVAPRRHCPARVRSTVTLASCMPSSVIAPWDPARHPARRWDAPAAADAYHNNSSRAGLCRVISGASPNARYPRTLCGSPSRRSRSEARPRSVLEARAAHVTA